MNTLFISCDPELYALYYSSPKNYKTDAGFDLFCPCETVVKSMTFSNKIDMQIVGRLVNKKGESIPWKIYPRSSMGSKTPLRLSNSVAIIDANYRGNIMVLVDNLSDKDYTIQKGDRIVQCVAFDGQSIISNYTSYIDLTERGDGGLGSTGN